MLGDAKSKFKHNQILIAIFVNSGWIKNVNCLGISNNIEYLGSIALKMNVQDQSQGHPIGFQFDLQPQTDYLFHTELLLVEFLARLDLEVNKFLLTNK